MEAPASPPTLRDAKQICFIDSSLEEFKNPEGNGDNEKPYFK